MKYIIKNSLQTPDGTVLTSYHRHDYKTYTDKNGKVYMIDGGLDYVRSSNNGDEKYFTITDDVDFEIIRKNFHWGVNYTKDMELLPETKWTPICDLSTEHILAILDEGYGSSRVRGYFLQELKERNDN